MLYSQNSMSTDKVTIVSFYRRPFQANVYFVMFQLLKIEKKQERENYIGGLAFEKIKFENL